MEAYISSNEILEDLKFQATGVVIDKKEYFHGCVTESGAQIHWSICYGKILYTWDSFHKDAIWSVYKFP